MSAIAIPTSPKSPARPRPVPVRPTPSRPVSGIGFLALVAVFLGGGMFGLLVLNTAVQEQGFVLADLKAQSKLLSDEADYLDSRLESARSPGGLAEAAGDLGMIPAGNPAYLRLSDGVVVSSDSADTRGFAYIRTPKQQRHDAESASERAKKEAAEKAVRDQQAAEQAAKDKLKNNPPAPRTEPKVAGGNR